MSKEKLLIFIPFFEAVSVFDMHYVLYVVNRERCTNSLVGHDFSVFSPDLQSSVLTGMTVSGMTRMITIMIRLRLFMNDSFPCKI